MLPGADFAETEISWNPGEGEGARGLIYGAPSLSLAAVKTRRAFSGL